MPLSIFRGLHIVVLVIEGAGAGAGFAINCLNNKNKGPASKEVRERLNTVVPVARRPMQLFPQKGDEGYQDTKSTF